MSTASLSRSFYLFGIFILVLLAIPGIFQSYTFLKVGEAIYQLPSFPNWFVVNSALTMVGLTILLKYYQYKKYWYAFSTGLLYALAVLFSLLSVYTALNGGDISDYYIYLHFTVLTTGIFHAISLFYSRAGKRYWLRAAGLYLLVLDVASLLFMIGRMNIQDAEIYGVLVAIQQWTSLVGNLLPVLFILNFLRELKELRPVNVPANLLARSLNGFFMLAGLAALVCLIMPGQKVIHEADHAVASLGKNATYEAMSARPYEARTFVGRKGDKLPYRLMKPRDYDPQKKYPLVIHLHGGEGRGTDNVKQIFYGAFSTMLEEKRRQNYPAFIFVPQCPTNAVWGGAPYIPSMEDLVFEAIKSLEEEFSIDEKRRYLMGASLGGYGTWHFISSRPEFFAAAVPVCGGGDPELIPNAVDLPLWAFHGRLDDLVPVSKTREMIEALKKAGGNPRYTEYPDKGHLLWEELASHPELLDWIFAQKRE